MLSEFISLWFPNSCVGCSGALAKNEKFICESCRSQLAKTNSHLESGNYIEIKFYGKVRLKKAMAFYKFYRKGLIQQILHHLKYKNKPELGVLLGQWYGLELCAQEMAFNFDYIVPVPLHPSKLRRRGYNQSETFARGLGETLNIPVLPDGLQRLRSTATQTKKSRLQRWKNVEQVFAVTSASLIKNRDILLVDDVITTGSTLESCAVELLRQSASSVSVAAIAAAK